MRLSPCILATLLLTGCVSTPSRPPPASATDPWSAVTSLDRGVHVAVVIDCSAEGVEGESGVAGGGCRVEGTLAEASAGSILVRPHLRGAAPVPMARVVVKRVFAERPGLQQPATLIGAAAAIGIIGALGVYGEEDLPFSGKVMISGIFGSAGAAFGYFISRHRPSLRLVYERPEEIPAQTTRDP